MRATRRTALLAVVAVATLGLAACSSEDPEPTPTAIATAAADVDTVADEVGDALTPESFAARLTTAMLAAGSVTQTMSTAVEGTTVDIVADSTFTKTSQDVRTRTDMGALGSVDVLVVGGTFWVNLGEMTDNKYVEVDPEDTSNPLSASFAGLTDQLDPKASVASLEGAVTTVERTGDSQELGGTTAWHHRVVVDTSRLDQSMLGAAGDVDAQLPAEIVYDYWIDDADLIHLVTVSVQGTDIEIAYSGWGEDKGIVAPTADQITDISALG